MTRFAVLGAGFWARFQMAAWREIGGAECVAVCDPDRARAERLAAEFHVPAVYTDAAALLSSETPDFVDIVAGAGAHAELVLLCAARRVPVICQKPMAETWADAQAMARACRDTGTPFFVHENFRWQAPLRRLGEIVHAGAIGDVFRARLSFQSAFPVYDNQPALARAERFILMDIGTHVLDVARFLLGEARTVHCKTRRVNPAIAGEDVATVLMEMRSGAHCTTELSYASLLEREAFPQTLALLEGTEGSVRLDLDGQIAVTTRAGTAHETALPPFLAWAEPAYQIAQAALVDCNRNLLRGVRGTGAAETTGADNLRTMQLVFACYQSAEENTVITLQENTE